MWNRHHIKIRPLSYDRRGSEAEIQIETPISRPMSRVKNSHVVKVTAFTQTRELVTSMLDTSIAPVFSLRWLRTQSRQTPIGIKRMAMQFASALVASATPEKRWCQAVSKGIVHTTV